MIIAISGTPGVGKHTVAKILANELNYKILKRRLEERGYSKKKIHDNILFEALDGTYIEAKELHNNVVEIDNSKSVDSTIRMIKKAINGKLKPQKIDYSYFIPKIEKF